MALIRPGGLVGQISGRVGGDVFSHNRYGQYVRAGSNPVTSTTTHALAAKARMTEVTQAWQGLTTAQKLAWYGWAVTNPVLNRLGQSITLTGHAAYVGLNARLLNVPVAKITDPPVEAAPIPLATLTLTADIGAGTTEIAFTATPLAAADGLYIKACVLDSAGINFVENYLRLIAITAAAQATGYDYLTVIEARFGTLAVGQIVVVEVGVLDRANGQLSALLRDQATVVST